MNKVFLLLVLSTIVLATATIISALEMESDKSLEIRVKRQAPPFGLGVGREGPNVDMGVYYDDLVRLMERLDTERSDSPYQQFFHDEEDDDY